MQFIETRIGQVLSAIGSFLSWPFRKLARWWRTRNNFSTVSSHSEPQPAFKTSTNFAPTNPPTPQPASQDKNPLPPIAIPVASSADKPPAPKEVTSDNIPPILFKYSHRPEIYFEIAGKVYCYCKEPTYQEMRIRELSGTGKMIDGKFSYGAVICPPYLESGKQVSIPGNYQLLASNPWRDEQNWCLPMSAVCPVVNQESEEGKFAIIPDGNWKSKRWSARSNKGKFSVTNFQLSYELIDYADLEGDISMRADGHLILNKGIVKASATNYGRDIPLNDNIEMVFVPEQPTIEKQDRPLN